MTAPLDPAMKVLVLDAAGTLADRVSLALHDPLSFDDRSAIPFCVQTAGTEAQASTLIKQASTQGEPYRVVYLAIGSQDDEPLLSAVRQWWQADPSLNFVACTASDEIKWSQLADRFGRGDGWLIIQGTPTGAELRQSAVQFTQRCACKGTDDNQHLLRKLSEAVKRNQMVEVTNGVLHNVGNVLNSVSVSAGILGDRIQHSKLSSLIRAASLIKENQDNLTDFIGHDERGKHLPGFLISLAEILNQEQQDICKELESVAQNLEHIKQVISTQQSYASLSGTTESVDLDDLVEDALRISRTGLERHDIQIRCQTDHVPPCLADRHKVLQILINLISNAKAALYKKEGERHLTIWIAPSPDQTEVIRLQVIDNGMGIESKDLERVFEHGFTTRSDGHGFGLHSAIRAAQEMNGRLYAESPGPGQGATFTLELPIDQVQHHADAADSSTNE